jgi:hypothetical protein
MLRLLIVGDSHARFFGITDQMAALRPELGGIELDLRVVQGATVTGLGRRVSHLRLRQTIDEALAGAPYDAFGLNIGQVDVELGYYYRRVVKAEDISPDAFVAGLAGSLAGFLGELRSRFAGALFVKGINPPVLCHDRAKAVRYIARIITENVQDPPTRERLRQRLAELLPSDAERVALHAALNTRLREFCRQADVFYFDIADRVLDADGLPRPDLIPAGDDHHLVDSLATRLLHWEALLERLPAKRG